MSRCNPAARWGPGTTCEKPVNTDAAREMEQRLAAMRRERDSVDKIWTAAAASPQKPQACEMGKCSIPKKAEDNKYITFRSSN
jgi:hypothetical protein